MNKLKHFLLFFAGFISYSNINGQVIDNEVIIQLNEGATLNINTFSRSIPTDSEVEVLSEVQNLYLLKSKDKLGTEFLKNLKAQRNVINAFYNVTTSQRAEPNDVHFDKQWAPNFMELDKVWETITGGATENGDEIVVAILDDGMDVNHEDIAPNIFRNTGEIANDNIDNDGNGFIDDVKGISALSSEGDHVVKTHGTWVCSILGSKGDNNVGIAGVNWNIKILPISGVRTKAGILKAYDYIYTMKKLYNDTNGQRGANILVSNYSGGIDKEFGTNPNNFAWCNFYDLLGSQGVLSVASTANHDDDVEEVGDMPATCTSPYLIAVTNVNKENLKSSGSGFGSMSIDLAAPGEEIYGAKQNDEYTSMDGTSASAPQVAGVAALLFSVECKGMQELLDFDQVRAIEYVRDAIFNGVQKNPNFEGITVTGGHLNAFGALQQMQDICDNSLLISAEKGPLEILGVTSTGSTIEIEYISPDESNYEVMWSDVLGRVLMRETISPQMYGRKVHYSNFKVGVDGVYIVSIYNDDAPISSRTVFIQGQ